MDSVPKRRRGQRGASPLSPATRRRLLTGLLRAAEEGDAAAAGVLVLLSFRAEHAKIAAGGQAEAAAS